MFHSTRVKERKLNVRGISLLNAVGKIYAGILVDRVHRVTGVLIDDDQGGFRAWRGCVNQILKVRKHEKKNTFINLEKEYDGVNKEALWQVLRMYNVEINF